MRLALVVALLAGEVLAQGRVFNRPCEVTSRRSSRGGVACSSGAAKSIGNAVQAGDKVGNWWQLNADGTTQAGSALTMNPINAPGVSPLTFNGTSQRYESSAAAAFPTGDFGFVTVINAAAEGGEIVSKWDGVTLVFTLELTVGITRFYVNGAALGVANGAGQAVGTWTCVGGRYTTATGAIIVRVAGANQGGNAAGGGVTASSQKHSVSGKTDGTGFFNGSSRGVFFSEKAFTDADIDRICAGAM